MRTQINELCVVDEKTIVREGCTLNYTLFKRVSTRCASFGLTLYSVRVRAITGGEVQESLLEDAFSDSGRALCFFRRIVSDLCTPSDAVYIMQDAIPY